MINTYTVKLESVWSAEIEFSDDATLDVVHHAIQEAVDFADDHLYEFFVARTQTARDRVSYDDENEKIYETRIRDVFPLPSKKKLFYLFDYGDCWMFTISKSRKKPHEPVDGVEYPRVVKETGDRPKQYEFDDEEDDWDEAA